MMRVATVTSSPSGTSAEKSFTGPVHISNYYVFTVAMASGTKGFGLEERLVFSKRFVFNNGVLAHTLTAGELGSVPRRAVVVRNAGLPGCG